MENHFEARRRKEQVAFFVVKFFRAHEQFKAISSEFDTFAQNEGLATCGLFEKVRELEQSLLFDLKEKAHALFRATADGTRRRSSARGGHKASAETRSIDSYIGTGYHLMLILQESLYQIERYSPELEKEHDEMGTKLAADSADLAARVMERCKVAVDGTAEVLYRFVTRSSDNEILMLNLLQNVDLLEMVYGTGSAEKLFSTMCKGPGFEGRTGTEKARAYVRSHCGNVTALPGA